MNNDGISGSNNGNGAPVQNRPFGEEMARETERVFRRAGGEPLDEYLRNINSYLTDLNSRLGVQPPEEPAPAQPEDAALPETEAPDGFFFAAPRERRPAYDAYAEPVYAPPGAARQPVYDGYAEPADDARQPVDDAYAGPAYDAYTEPADDAYAGPAYDAYTEPADDGDEFNGAFEGLYPEEAAFDEVPAEAFRFEPEQMGYVKNDWQAAVAHPELYPDLDDPAVQKRGHKKRARVKKEKAPKVTAGGQSRFSFVTTWINLALYAGWTVLYFVCLSVRSVMFTSTQTEMAMQGVANYSLSISSPLFTVLKILIYLMPVVVLLWMKGVLGADKKGLAPVDKRLLIAAFAADLTAGVVVIFDAVAAQLIFG
ncbi:MAG: hypothetical protein IJK89_06390 [Clostridia bacterium]|nr:hypothetical protein [Clostridia bacterium]